MTYITITIILSINFYTTEYIVLNFCICMYVCMCLYEWDYQQRSSGYMNVCVNLCRWYGADDSGPQAQAVEELPAADDSCSLARLLQKRGPQMQGQLTEDVRVCMHVCVNIYTVQYVLRNYTVHKLMRVCSIYCMYCIHVLTMGTVCKGRLAGKLG